jgi:glutamate dehydrogenase (NAD(P)+)
MKVTGISDAYAAFYRKDGIDVGKADAYAREHGSLAGFTEADPIPPGGSTDVALRRTRARRGGRE